jgi:NAD(P)-dependent dehydrogenase (short-subunit alcohol dehydrogenase family)
MQVAKHLRGCIVFTSSAAAAIASPFTALYAATKAFVSSFGASLAVEVRHRGIDVLVFHPSPVATRHDPPWKMKIKAPNMHCRGCNATLGQWCSMRRLLCRLGQPNLTASLYWLRLSQVLRQGAQPGRA